MQIRKIVLYNSNGEVRELTFELGKVNIITGESKTGKTALIEIINYCLGSKNCKIPKGFIRRNVMWFSLILSFKKEEIFVARINPDKINKKTTLEIYYSIGVSINEIPSIQELTPNSNIDLLHRVLEGKLGINEYINKPEKKTRDNLSVTFSHSRRYCFQPQDLIAQKSSLFFNQNSEDGSYVKQSIIDTLPYFLGAVREDTLIIEQEIAIVKKDLRRLYRELRAAENVKENGIARLFELVEEAKEVELIDPFEEYVDEEAVINSLNRILDWNYIDNSSSGNNDVLNNLVRVRRDIKEELERVKVELYAAKSFAEEARGYGKEIKEQEQRLKSIGLYKEVDNGKFWNSLIGVEVDYIPPTIENINKALSQLRENLETTTKEKPKLRNHINKLEEQKSNRINDLKLVSSKINAIYKEQEEAKKIRDLNIRKGKVLGIVSLFLESLDLTKDFSQVRKNIYEKESKLEELQKLVSKEEKEERMAAILNKINLQMSNWSNSLDIEYQGAPIRFDAKRLTLYADTDEKSIPLSQMGSGANWVSYHLLIHFGLHKHFIQAKRPVPRFLLLDQPSQVYYPPEKDDAYRGTLPSSDEIAVKQMFDFMLNTVESLENKLQVIVTDHARLKYPEFESSIIEIWRDGVKLVPLDWEIKEENNTTGNNV